MAKIRKFEVGARAVKAPQSEVDAFVQTVSGEDGELFLYLYNYSQRGPEVGGSPTQSLHFDAESAKRFKQILEQTFGPL